MPTTDLIFEEPPPTAAGGVTRGQSPLGLWLAALREHPGRWSKFPDPVGPSNGTTIRRGAGFGTEKGEFSIRTAKIDGSAKVTMFARYDGPVAP